MNPREYKMHRILLVDDERGVLNALQRLLRLTPLVVRGVEWHPRVDVFTSPEIGRAHV